MEKRYQVFVSSTYQDLIKERQEVMHALLELDCIPTGMELFPAADEEKWSFIKRVIEDCDYYIVIIAGRYGSVGPTGISYTQMEYEFAVERGKPVIAFLHRDPGGLADRDVEQSPEGKGKLEAFRKLAQNKMCKHWGSPVELGSVVSRSLIQLIKMHPGVGWVRGDNVPDESAAKEMLRLRRRIEELQAELEKVEDQAPAGSGGLAQGDDQMRIRYSFGIYKTRSWAPDERYEGEMLTTWNELFFLVAPAMIDETSESSFRKTLDSFVEGRKFSTHSAELGRVKIGDFRVSGDEFQTIKVQLRALGLITMSTKQRSLKDTQTYWKLTPHGDRVMTQLRAVRRDDSNASP